jgi:hypothetical protein
MSEEARLLRPAAWSEQFRRGRKTAGANRKLAAQ